MTKTFEDLEALVLQLGDEVYHLLGLPPSHERCTTSRSAVTSVPLRCRLTRDHTTQHKFDRDGSINYGSDAITVMRQQLFAGLARVDAMEALRERDLTSAADMMAQISDLKVWRKEVDSANRVVFGRVRALEMKTESIATCDATNVNRDRRCMIARGHAGMHIDNDGAWDDVGAPPAVTTLAPEKWYWTRHSEHWDEERSDEVGGPFNTRDKAFAQGENVAQGKPFWTGRRDPIVHRDVAPAMFDIDDAIEAVNSWLSDNAGVEEPDFDIAPALKKMLEDEVYGVIIGFFEKHKLYEESWVIECMESHNEPVKWRDILDPGKRGWPSTTRWGNGFECSKSELLAIADTRRMALLRANVDDREAVDRFDKAYMAAHRELGG